MPSLEENAETWKRHDWARRGEEWSEAWGGADAQFWGAIWPRVRPFLPAGTILEIAPGFGRWTHYLVHLCRRLILVDLEPSCIAACRERFARFDHVEYHVNDGRSLAMIGAGTIDFAFSFDSLVHAEIDVVRAYLEQLATLLTPEGVGFFHHSNLADFRDPHSGELPFENLHWRAATVSAAGVAAICSNTDLAVVAQEIVNWGGEPLNDCFSVFTRRGSPRERPLRVWENREFMAEASALRTRAEHYEPLTQTGSGSAALELAGRAWRGGWLRRLLGGR